MNLFRIVAIFLVIALTGCSDFSLDGGKEHWRFAIEETRGSVQDAYAQRFKELVEARSGGEIQVDVYPYGTLGTSDQVTEQLGMGTIQFAMASPGHMGTLIPEVQVFLLHFVLSDDPLVNKDTLRDPALLSMFDDLYAEKGLSLLSIYQEGWMVWTTKKPVREPADFDGVKIRVMTSPLLIAAYREYGASPTPLPYGEVYSALQLNMIDAQVNPVFAIQEMSFYEVTDYMIFAHHAPYITTTASNKAFLAGLSPERRKMVGEIIAELDEFIFEKQTAYNAARLEIIRERKPDIKIISDLTDEERDKFREASMAVREEFVELAGPRARGVLELLVDTVHKHEKR